MNKNDCILVTGANGLAGSAVVEHLIAHQFTNVISLTRDDVDLRSHTYTREMFESIQPAYVFHPAATVYGIIGNMRNQGKAIFDNTLINISVIDACHQVGVKKLVAMGTNAVYPSPPQLPYRENNIFDGRPHAAEAAYGHAKRHMLAMLEAYNDSYGLEYTYLVSGNLYGPRDKFNPETGHVLPSLIAKFHEASVNEGYHVQIWGDGTPTRDFLYSADLAEIVRISFEREDVPAVMNIGSGQTASIEYVAKRLSGISGVNYSRVHYDRLMPNGRSDCFADLTKLRALSFRPKFTLGAGLESTYDWYAKSKIAA